MAFLLALLLLQAPQIPARDRPLPAAAGTAVIAGRIVDAESGEPIAAARVQVLALDVTMRLAELETNARGEFRFDGLAAGDYVVAARPAELHATHVSAVLNRRGPAFGMPKPSLSLAAGEVRDDIVVRLPRALAIEGRVVDEGGEPMGGVRIDIEPVTPDSRAMNSMFGTDDRGQFRIYGLSAGAFRVCATPGTDFRLGPPPTSGATLERRYVKTCYPSTPAGAGDPVITRPGALPVIAIVMQRVKAFTISGTAVSESGDKEISVHISRISGEGVSIRPEVHDGRFLARGVPPGEYYVSANSGREMVGLNSAITTEYGRVRVQVDAADVSGLHVVASKGATLLGRVVPEVPLPAGTKLQVQPAYVFGMRAPGYSGGPATVRPDLTFSMARVHEEMMLDVIGLPPQWVLTGVRYRGRDVTDMVTSFTSTVDPNELQLLVSPRSGQLLARPLDDQGQVTENAVIVLLQSNGERVLPVAFGMGKPVADGAMESPSLRPGNYLVVALPVTDMRLYRMEPGRLTALRQLGKPVTIAPGDRTQIDVVVRSLEVK